MFSFTIAAHYSHPLDRYGAVVRGANAYVPPGARRVGSSSGNTTPAPAPQAAAKTETVKVSVNGPDASTPKEASKPSSPAPENATGRVHHSQHSLK